MPCTYCRMPASKYESMCDTCLQNWGQLLARNTANSHDHNCHAWGCK